MKIRFEAPRAGYKARLFVDGVEVRGACAIEIRAAVNEVTKVTITYLPERVEVKGDAEVEFQIVAQDAEISP